jgi:hypothetical protein
MATSASVAIPIITADLKGNSAALSSPKAAPVFCTWVKSSRFGMIAFFE